MTEFENALTSILNDKRILLTETRLKLIKQAIELHLIGEPIVFEWAGKKIEEGDVFTVTVDDRMTRAKLSEIVTAVENHGRNVEKRNQRELLRSDSNE